MQRSLSAKVTSQAEFGDRLIRIHRDFRYSRRAGRDIGPDVGGICWTRGTAGRPGAGVAPGPIHDRSNIILTLSVPGGDGKADQNHSDRPRLTNCPMRWIDPSHRDTPHEKIAI